MLRDHSPIIIKEFNGLYDRGDKDNTPLDHFQDCNNIRYIGDSSIGSRYGIGISQGVSVPLTNIRRIYDFPTQTANTLIILTYDYNLDEGSIYHLVDSTTVYGPLLTIAGMKDFAFLPYDGRGYISPFSDQIITQQSPTPVTVSVNDGTGLGDGNYEYALTWVRNSDETLPSSLALAVTNSGIADPSSGLGVNTSTFVGTQNNLVIGDTYRWKFVFRTLGGGTTAAGSSESVGEVNTQNNDAYSVVFNGTIPSGAYYLDYYRTIGNGSTYYFELTVLASGATFLNRVGLITDAAIVANPTIPVSNTTAQEAVNVTGIPITAPPDATGKNLYRTAVNDSQLQLLSSLALSATTFDDTTPDSSLGVNAPTTNTYTTGTELITRGLANEFLYVYDGLGHAARKAAGTGMSGTMTIAFGAAGNMDPGIHIFGIVSETSSGYLSPPSILTQFTTNSDNSVSFGDIPTSGDPDVIARYLVSSTTIDPTAFTGNLSGYDMFFVPNAVINNNTDTFLNNISFYDADLLDDATYLFDNYTEIPAGAVLTLYDNRLVLAATYNDISLAIVSANGEPESISQVDGLLIFPLNGDPITNAQELRDVLYVTKKDRTGSFTDNGDVPSSWPFSFIDNALGSFVHGIATVLDSGSTNVDFLIICTYQGISLFNGRYVTPELTWKIRDFWVNLDQSNFDSLQIVNSPVNQEIYIILPNRELLVGNYLNGIDSKSIRWSPWSFAMGINTVAINNINEIIFGSDLNT